MENKKTLLILSLIFILVMAGAYVMYENLKDQVTHDQLMTQPATTAATTPTEMNSTEPDKTAPTETGSQEPVMAPDFTVYDLEGNEVRLSDYFGKPIVLNFWASWCGPCKMEMPDFQEKYLALGTEINFLMINMTDGTRETVESASSFIAKQGYTFPVFYDTSSEAAYVYGAYSLPTTYFINAQGHAIAQAVGAIDADTLQQGIDMITSDEP
jgi:thiol-disulfide isomerase/thioredoxin